MQGEANVSVFGERVLRVRLCRDAPRWISIKAQLAASQLRAQGLRVVLDDVPAGYRDQSNWSWTEDPEVGEVLKLWAGGYADDPVPAQMVVAWSLEFHATRRRLTMVGGGGRRLDN